MQVAKHIDPRCPETDLLICFVPASQCGGARPRESCKGMEEDVKDASGDSLKKPCREDAQDRDDELRRDVIRQHCSYGWCIAKEVTMGGTMLLLIPG